MWSNTLGDAFRITTFGESHGPACGVVIEGVQPGLAVDLQQIQAELDARRPGQGGPAASGRREPDRVEVLAGLFEGRTTGAPLALLIRSVDARPQAYEALRDRFRPGHGDWTWLARYGTRDWRGGGRVSGRETVARVAAGALARQILAPFGVRVHAQTTAIADVHAEGRDPALARRDPLRCGDPRASAAMQARLEEARAAGDSLGGVVEVVAEGVPAGWGDPVFGKLDARIGGALLSIGGVKALSFGEGFEATTRRGSEHQDALTPTGPATNRAGGMWAGISNGAPLVVSLAVKPTPSIRLPLDTITTAGQPTTVSTAGRHDVCLCPRIVPVAEAMVAFVLADACLAWRATRGDDLDLTQVRAEIDATDAEIARLFARRLALAHAAGGLKAAEGTPVRVPSRERVVARNWSALAEELGVPPEAAARLRRLLIREARALQERERQG